MARLWAVAIAVLLLGAAAGDDGQAVRAAFDAYRTAVTARDGRSAALLVSAGSLAAQERLRDLALVAPQGEVEALPPTDRLMVLRLRHEFTAEELRPLSGADLIRIAVEEAWSSPKVLAPLTAVAVEQQEDVAALRVERAGEPVPIRLKFRREAGAWKLDLVELAHGSDAALAESLAFRAQRAKVPIQEVMRWLIEDTSGPSRGQGPVAAAERGNVAPALRRAVAAAWGDRWPTANSTMPSVSARWRVICSPTRARFSYQAGSWTKPRRVVEWHPGGLPRGAEWQIIEPRNWPSGGSRA